MCMQIRFPIDTSTCPHFSCGCVQPFFVWNEPYCKIYFLSSSSNEHDNVAFKLFAISFEMVCCFRNFELCLRLEKNLMKIYDRSSSICQLDDNNKMNFTILHSGLLLLKMSQNFRKVLFHDFDIIV